MKKKFEEYEIANNDLLKQIDDLQKKINLSKERFLQLEINIKELNKTKKKKKKKKWKKKKIN